VNVFSLFVAAVLAISTLQCHGQVIHERETFSGLTSPQVVSDTLPGPQYMRERVADGKLRLTLRDAIVLTLMNNMEVRVQELNVENAKYNLLQTHAPFDPRVVARFDAQRVRATTTDELRGADTLNTLNQTTTLSYTQTFESGTNLSIGFNASKFSTNSAFSFLNPSVSTGLNFAFDQPVLRNGWWFANRAPIVIARHNLRATRASFEAQVADSIQAAVTQYWEVIRRRGSLDVARKLQDAAEVTYRRAKRSLELGALPPLDIYQSESQVASRRVSTIQVEYVLKQAEDQLRFTLGANSDPYFRALDLDLTESPHVPEELRTIDEASALSQAMSARPELESVRQSLAGDEVNIKLAHNHLLPDLRVGANYSSNGVGGNLYDTTTVPPQLISRGGLGDSLGQVFGFGFPTYGFTVNLDLPLRNRGGQAELGTALVARRRDLYNRRQLQEQITLDVANAVHQLEQSKLELAASRLSLDLAQKNLNAEQRKYDLGEKRIDFVLNAQTAVAEAELSLVQAEIGYQIALVAVDHATGNLLDSYRVQIAELTK